jgi:hypothetical protein
MERDYISAVLKAKNWRIGGEDSAASTLLFSTPGIWPLPVSPSLYLAFFPIFPTSFFPAFLTSPLLYSAFRVHTSEFCLLSFDT